MYLILYNVAQALGWLSIGILATRSAIEGDSVAETYSIIEDLLKIFQTAAILEVLHCCVGLVKSSPVLTAFQVASRVFLVWGIIHSVPQTQNQLGVLMLLSAWTVTEVIRYSYYAFSLLGSVPYALLWLRYTLFLVLYPIGVSGELMTIFAAAPVVQKSGLYSLSLPNKLNVSFHYNYFLFTTMLSYIPIFPQLFGHMLKQRTKFLGPKKSE